LLEFGRMLAIPGHFLVMATICIHAVLFVML
jgi:hypothetical protein